MRVNRGSTGGGSSDQGDGSRGMSAPGSGSGGSQGSQGSGGMRAPAGGGAQREGAGELGSRTDRGNQNDEGVGSSASRGGGGGEINTPRSGNPTDPDATTDAGSRFGIGGGSSGNPDVTGTTDVDGG